MVFLLISSIRYIHGQQTYNQSPPSRVRRPSHDYDRQLGHKSPPHHDKSSLRRSRLSCHHHRLQVSTDPVNYYIMQTEFPTKFRNPSITSIVFESFLFGLAMFRYWTAHSQGWQQVTLFQVLIRDNMWTFLIIFGMSVPHSSPLSPSSG